MVAKKKPAATKPAALRAKARPATKAAAKKPVIEYAPGRGGKMMSFDTAFVRCWKKGLTFSGRASRAEYWWFYLANLILGFIPLVGIVYNFAVIIPSFAVIARRMHDIGKSGWSYFKLCLVIGVAGAIAGYFGKKDGGIYEVALALGAAAVVLFCLVMSIVWLARPGGKGTNRYGRPE